MGQNPVLIDPNQPHYQLKMFKETKNEERVLKIPSPLFPSKSRCVIDCVNMHINRQRELLLINEKNNVSCVTPLKSSVSQPLTVWWSGFQPPPRKPAGPV